MAGINVRSTSGKLEDNVGKDLRKEQYVTGQPIGSNRRAMDTIAMGVYLVADDIVEAGSSNNLVNLTAHQARVGDFLRIKTSANNIQEFEVAIDEIVSPNSLRLGAVLSASLAVGDTVSILRPVSPRMAADGATLASIAPAATMYRKDGALVEVNEDTVTPSNTAPLPVKIIALDGTNINITAGDLNVQTSHTGASYDSMRIGDGTDLLAVNADGSINIGNLPATQPISAVSLPLPAGAATSAKQDTLLAELQLKAKLTDTQPVSVASLPLPTGAATAAKQDTLLAELQLKAKLTDTQPVSAASLPLPSGASTAANQTTGNTSLASIDTKLTSQATAANQTTGNTSLATIATGTGAPADAAVTNPASSASVIAALKGALSLLSTLGGKLDIIDANTSSSFTSITNMAAAATVTTVNPPAGAVGMIIQNSTNSGDDIRIAGTAQTPSASVGFMLGVGQSTSYMPAGAFKYYANTAPDACVIWFV